MIVPSKNQKTYGVLHTENYFSFLGFCKKVNSDEIQKVDVYLDDVLIDTIIANKHLQKIEDIYELDGFGFSYNLPEEYIGQKSLINFKNHETQENLHNSPYILIDCKNINFNKARFIHNVEIFPDKDIIVKNSIGFLVTAENLEDIDFTNYLKELIINFPQIKIKAFYFYDEDLNLAKKVFEKELDKFDFSIPANINELTKEINIYLFNSKYPLSYRESYNSIVKDFSRIYPYQFFANYKQLKLIDYDKIFENHPHMINPDFFNLSIEDNSYTKTTFNPILKKLNLPQIRIEENLYKFYHFDCLEYVLNNDSIKMYFSDLTKKYLEYRKNEIR